MSRSQSRCMMLILRHAWLNLLDKHMTTGRINQVAVRQRIRLPMDCSMGPGSNLESAHSDCVALHISN